MFDKINEFINVKQEKIISYFNNFANDIKDMNKENYIEIIIKRKKIILSIVVIILLVCTTGFYNNNSIGETLDIFKEAVLNADSRKLSKVIKVNDIKTSEENLKPLLNYLQSIEIDIEDLINNLKRNGKSSIFILKSNKTVFGEENYINIESILGQINTNIEGVEIKLGDVRVPSDGMIKNIVPGKYKLSYKLNTEFGEVVGVRDVVFVDNANYNLEVEAKHITLYSSYEDAKVIINNKYIDKKVSEIKKYGPIPNKEDMFLAIEKDFPWGSIRSEEISLYNGEIFKLEIDMVNESLLTDINSTMEKFYLSVFDGLNKRDKNLISNCTEDVKNKIYDDIEEKTLLFKNNYEISDLEVKVENSEFLYDKGMYKANVVVSTKYNVYKKLIPFAQKKYDELFLIGLEFVDDYWTIVSSQNFSM